MKIWRQAYLVGCYLLTSTGAILGVRLWNISYTSNDLLRVILGIGSATLGTSVAFFALFAIASWANNVLTFNLKMIRNFLMLLGFGVVLGLSALGLYWYETSESTRSPIAPAIFAFSTSTVLLCLSLFNAAKLMRD